MIKTLTRTGNSYALVIDRPILDLLRIDERTPLDVTTDGQKLVVQPLGKDERGRRFKAALAETNREYARMLKRLARE
jgi:antitoxin component of MazEF toxin-antitoxin module